jgi:hypothetical protein
LQRSDKKGRRNHPQVGRLVDCCHQRTSSSVASCSESVSLQATTIGGVEHKIGLTRLRMLGRQKARGAADVQLGSKIADALMPLSRANSKEPIEGWKRAYMRSSVGGQRRSLCRHELGSRHLLGGLGE